MTSVDDASVAQDPAVGDPVQQLVGNFYLRFPDKESFDLDSKEAGFWIDSDDGGVLRTSSFDHNFDVIGIIDSIVEPADIDAGTDAVTERLPGWHVNFSGHLPEAWLPYVVTPKNPVRWMR